MIDAALKRYLESLNRQINGLLTMNRLAKSRDEAFEKRLDAIEQAMLEMDAALRRSGAYSDGLWALSLLPSDEDPDRQSADPPSTVST